MTYSERLKIVEDFKAAVTQKFQMVDQYNILVFGSFLTDRYRSQSDIDLGVFSLSPALGFRIYSFTKDYFDQLGIENDVIRMRLLNSQFINLPIVLEQKYAVTDYCPAELIDYVKMMLAEYGNNPQAEMVKKMRLEVV